ncbi:MAG: DUF4129 domain-containing protein [Candidatus Bipolaricaulaceae bacterium]
MKRGRAWIFGGLALAALVVLVAGLQGTPFRGGKTWPSAPAPTSGRAGPERPALPLDWPLQLLRALFLAGLVALVLALFVRDLRRHLLRFLFLLGLLLLAWYGLQRWLKPEEAGPPAATRVPPALSSAEASTEGAASPPPPWAIYVAALAAGVLLALGLLPRILERVWSGQQARAIAAAAREAREELAQGAPVQDVVLRCWLRMVEILSRRSGARDQPHLTPREFAQALARLGFQDEAISLLTQLFEEVRYGRKDSESRRERALAALAALEKAYG